MQVVKVFESENCRGALLRTISFGDIGLVFKRQNRAALLFSLTNKKPAEAGFLRASKI